MNDLSPPQGLNLRPRARATSFDPVVARAFGLVVRRERVKRGIAQDDLANIAAIDRSFYGKLERGERQPSLGTLLRIATALATSGSELLKEVEKEMLSHAPPADPPPVERDAGHGSSSETEEQRKGHRRN